MALVLLAGGVALGQDEYVGKGHPKQVKAIRYLSAADNTEQPALFYAPPGDKPAPLLVGLHSWSADYRQPSPYGAWCVKKGWVFIQPDFRGPNKRPEATGSELVVKDILSAVEYAKKNAKVDESRIYLIGASGGGYATLLMAGRAPEVWAGVSAWVPIYDLKAWHQEKSPGGKASGYALNMEASCGGAPGASAAVDEQYVKRSASTYLKNAVNLKVDIGAGIHDGHKGSVPISHSLRAFNALAKPEDRLSEEEIAFFTEKEQVPPALVKEIEDPLFPANKKVLFRRESANVRVTIFEGGHEMVAQAALTWLEQQRKGGSGR